MLAVFGSHRHIVGYHIHPTGVKQLYSGREARGYLKRQGKVFVGYEFRQQFIVVTHSLVTVEEIGCGAVEGGHTQGVGKRYTDMR